MGANNIVKSIQTLGLFLLVVSASLSGCQRNHDTIQQGSLSYNVTDVFGAQTQAAALARAASRGDVTEINHLVATGADVNIVGKENITPLWWAAWSENYDGFKALVDKGANPNAQRAEGLPVMHLIANVKDARFLDAALKHGGDPDSRDRKSGETPLFLAVLNGYEQQIELLLAAKANVNMQDPISGETVLMEAVGTRNYKLVFRLLQAGADPTLKTKFGEKTVVDFLETGSANASNNRDPWRSKVIELLRSKGMNVKDTAK